MFQFWMVLSDMIRWEYIWHHTMVTSAFSLSAAVQAGISAWWFFITDLIWASTAALFSRGCVPAEWRWARVKITLHIHLTNWLYNAARKKPLIYRAWECSFCTLKISLSISSVSSLNLQPIYQVKTLVRHLIKDILSEMPIYAADRDLYCSSSAWPLGPCWVYCKAEKRHKFATLERCHLWQSKSLQRRFVQKRFIHISWLCFSWRWSCNTLFWVATNYPQIMCTMGSN